MNETMILESPTLRNELCNEANLAVLDRVGKLITLSESDYALTDGVCGFYEIKQEVLRQTVTRNRKELLQDGYKVLSKKEFEKLHPVTFEIPNRGLAIFPRRVVLRIGMLLRDSKVAQAVRTYLLDVEARASLGDWKGEALLAKALSELRDQQIYLVRMFTLLFEEHYEILQKLEGLGKADQKREKRIDEQREKAKKKRI